MRLHPQLLQFAALFDCLHDVQAWIKDPECRYRWVNRSFVLSYMIDRPCAGTRPMPDLDDILGKTDYDLSPPFLADQFRLDDEQVLAGHRIVDRIEQVGQPDELGVWNITNKLPILDADGMVIGTAGLTRRLGAPEIMEAPLAGVGPVLAYFRDHFQAPITNEQLARLAHMSVRSFERKFHASLHLTPQKYLRKVRLRMASRTLVFTERPIADVALGCGFVDQSHLTREFRRHFGRTPRAYRRHYAHPSDPAAPVTKTDAGTQAVARPATLDSDSESNSVRPGASSCS